MADQWVFFGMFYGLDCEIDVEVWPVQMMRAWQLHSSNGRDGRVLEPRKIAKRDKQLAFGDE